MLTAKLILERFDKDHRLLEKRVKPSRSFLRAFIQFLYCAHAQIQAAAPYNMNDITNAVRTIDCQAGGGNPRGSKANLMIGSPGGDSGVFCCSGWDTNVYVLLQTIAGEYIGIQVGTGVAAVTPADFALQTRVAHGRAAGELEYGGCELVNIAIANPNGEFTIRRYFTNYSGGGITVQEVGIYTPGTDYDSYSAWAFCIARDLTGAVAVANTELLRVSYVVQITV